MLASFASWLLGSYTQRRWGVQARIVPELVRVLGPVGALRWAGRHLPPMMRGLNAMGPLRGYLAFMYMSLLNGCAYCAFAEGRALQLHFLKDRGRLFPLDEHAVVGLLGLPDEELLARLEHALAEVHWAEEVTTLRRIRALKYRAATPETDEDRFLLHAIDVHDLLNSCALRGQLPLDDAHDPINKDAPLKRRYAQARLGRTGVRS